MSKTILAILSIFLLSLESAVYAQVNPLASSTKEELATEPEISPRKRVQELLGSISETSPLPLKANFDARDTRLLKYVKTNEVISVFPDLLDRYGELVPTGLISNAPDGTEEIGLGPEFEKIGDFSINGETYPILLELITFQSGDSQWLVSQRTIFDVSEIVNEIDESRINRTLPQSLIDNKFKGVPIGQWIGIMVIALLCAMIGWAIALSLTKLAKSHFENNESSRKSQVFKALSIPVGIIGATVIFLWIERYLEFSIIIRQDFSILTISAVWIAVFIFAWSLIDNLSSHGEAVLREKNRVGSLSIIIFFRATAKVAIVALALIFILSSNGIDVTTGLAALGIGGIALALGAQKAIENLVGSVIIVTDQPIRVGDFCKVGDTLGTVESIGLRSTRIRTLADTMVTFPNGMLSSEKIENYTLRRKFLCRTTLNLRYETKVADIKRIVEEMRTYLKDSDSVSNENMRVAFIGYGAASLDVEILCYIYADDYNLFLELQEDVLLGLTEIIENNQSGFAYPSQTLYLARDKAP